MISNNETKKLSRNRKRRMERKNKMSSDMKLLLIKIKSEKKKKNKNLDKNKQLEILLVRIKYADNPNKLESALKELNKIQVIDKNLHEIKQEILQDYIGTIEMVGNLKVGDQVRHLMLDLEIQMISKLILTRSMKVMMPKTLFSMVIFTKSILLNLIKSIDLNTETAVVLIK